MMASDKTNYVVNYFTVEISDIVNNQLRGSNQCSQSICEYELLTNNQSAIEIKSNDIIFNNNTVIDMENVESNNNNDKIHIIENFVIPSKSSPELECSVVASDDSNSEDDLEDLTNLNWLTELKNITNLPPTTNEITEKPCDPPSQRFDKFINQVHKIRESYEKRGDVYQTSSTEKPPFNYAQIIAMAMLDEGKMTLKQICDWIENKFAYYKLHKNWNNSIRHNLSLNFFFTKVARDKNEKGKGGYWQLAVDGNKTARKRIRQRKRKTDGNITNPLHARSRFLRDRDVCKPKKQKLNESFEKSASSTAGSDSFLSSPSYANDDSNPSNYELNGMEIIEEQQNINNIIDDQSTIIITNPIFESPNVIVEAIPSTYQFSHFSHIEHFDENELNQLICMDDQELIDDFLSYETNENGEFL